ncbi:diguanylate cyclase [Jatrophihabitans telluris]|uniref:Diguanylate cyclase n=1 Tax=Jatrophihabitans telluris TaxID=2038343 RepID=A0ABY4R359_9ACTN|nr:diguanylate cyclase [Jatrophihabitans telluris]UQX89772.1 diguanylate cyclase [Jatrophihabitans telluris]
MTGVLRALTPDAVTAAAAEGGAPALAVGLPTAITAAAAPRAFATTSTGATLDAARIWTVRWANPAAAALLGSGPHDLLGNRLPAAYAAAAADGLPGPWMQVVSDVIAELIDPDGEEFAWDWHSASVDTPDRGLVAVQLRVRPVAESSADDPIFVVWLRAVTDGERRAEEAQRESEHRFRALADHAPVGIVVSEAGLRLSFVNNRFAEIAGGHSESLLGTDWLKTIHPEDLPGLLEGLDEVLSGASLETTVRMISISDSQRWVQFRLSPVTTPRRSAGFIGTVEDITARRAWENQLTYQASHDALTGLANRRSMVEALTQLLSSRRSRDRDAAVLFCDLDGFKQINDTLGHDAGDRVLIEVAQRLSTTARDHDLVARIAGDEFVVMIREVGSYADAEAAAGRQLKAMLPAIRVAGRAVHVTASIGIAMARDYDTATALLQAADRGMYEAKRSGTGLYRGAQGVVAARPDPEA